MMMVGTERLLGLDLEEVLGVEEVCRGGSDVSCRGTTARPRRAEVA